MYRQAASFQDYAMRAAQYLAMFITMGGVCVVASPSQNPDRPPVLSVKTDLVTLPITVVDRDGAFVAGLRPEHTQSA